MGQHHPRHRPAAVPVTAPSPSTNRARSRFVECASISNISNPIIMNSSQEITPLSASAVHSYHRRSFHHDYYNPFIYHIILKKKEGCEAFGSITGDAGIPYGNPGCAAVNESRLGKIIAKTVLHLPYDYPILKLHQFCVMPDHLHLLLQVLFRSDKHLDFYIDCLKDGIARRHSVQTQRSLTPDDIFEKGYCDKPLYDGRSIDGWYKYIRENPHRLAMRRQYPRFFRRVRNLKIGTYECQAYGNLFLLRNPDKIAVKISRRYSEEEKLKKKKLWIEGASQGTVIVSPFISPAEKSIRSEVEALGGKIILITHEAFPERFKPAKHDFDLCAEGRLLIVSLGRPAPASLSRADCMAMNGLAEVIALCGSVTARS